MRAKNVGTRMLQWDVKILRDILVARDGFEQARGDLVGIRIEKPQPLEASERSECIEKIGQFHASPEFRIRREVFAIACSVLADERDLAHTLRDEMLRLGDDGCDGTRAELAAKLRDDAEAAGMVAAFRNFDIRRGAWRREDAWRIGGVEIGWQRRMRAVPGLARKAAGGFAGIAFRPRCRLMNNLCAVALGTRVLIYRRGVAINLGSSEDVKGRVRLSGHRPREARSFEDRFKLARANDGVDLRDVLLDLVAISLDEATRNDEFPGAAALGDLGAPPSRGWCRRTPALRSR